MIATIREPEPTDVARVSCRMREIDIAECRAMGFTPWTALVEARRTSVLYWTGEIDGWPEAMFGVAPASALTGVGLPWFLGSVKARRAQRQFLREAPKYLERIEAIFPRLEGHVHCENHAAHVWLARMGFRIEDWYQVISNGEPLYKFTKGF